MANDMSVAIDGKDVNVKSAVCSALPTGSFAKRVIRQDTKINITSIESKYDTRFDDPSYYYGNGDNSGS